MRKGLPNRCRPRARGRSPGSRRPEGQGRLRTSGVCTTSSGRQSASGRSGPAAGRWAVGRRDGTRQAPRTSTRRRSGAGLRRSRGGRVCASAVPSKPVLGKKTALSRESRQPGSARRRGRAQPCQCQGPRDAQRGSAGGPTPGRGRGKGLGGRKYQEKSRQWRCRRRRLRASAPSAPRLGITHAGGGGRRERGGKGAGRVGPRARGRSGPRAPCGPRGAARGPPREAGPAGRGPRALSSQRGSLPRG